MNSQRCQDSRRDSQRIELEEETEYDEKGERKYNKKLKYKVTVTVYIYTVNVASLHIYIGNTRSDAGEF